MFLRGSLKLGSLTISMSLEVETDEPDDPRYDEGTILYEVEVLCEAPVPAWRGPAHTCPSSDDYYGSSGGFDDWDTIQVWDNTLPNTRKGKGQVGNLRPADAQEVARLEKWVKKHQDVFDNSVVESIQLLIDDNVMEAFYLSVDE